MLTGFRRFAGYNKLAFLVTDRANRRCSRNMIIAVIIERQVRPINAGKLQRINYNSALIRTLFNTVLLCTGLRQRKNCLVGSGILNRTNFLLVLALTLIILQGVCVFVKADNGIAVTINNLDTLLLTIISEGHICIQSDRCKRSPLCIQNSLLVIKRRTFAVLVALSAIFVSVPAKEHMLSIIACRSKIILHLLIIEQIADGGAFYNLIERLCARTITMARRPVLEVQFDSNIFDLLLPLSKKRYGRKIACVLEILVNGFSEFILLGAFLVLIPSQEIHSFFTGILRFCQFLSILNIYRIDLSSVPIHVKGNNRPPLGRQRCILFNRCICDIKLLIILVPAEETILGTIVRLYRSLVLGKRIRVNRYRLILRIRCF